MPGKIISRGCLPIVFDAFTPRITVALLVIFFLVFEKCVLKLPRRVLLMNGETREWSLFL